MPQNDRAEVLAPQPFPEMPGCSFYFKASDCRDATKASKIISLNEVIRELVGLNLDVIDAVLPHGLHNGDGSSWKGGVDALPISISEIGRRLADALHRRLWGEPLGLGDDHGGRGT